MKNVITWLINRMPVQIILSVFAYIIHWTLTALALTPGILFLGWGWSTYIHPAGWSVLTAFLLGMAIMIAYFLYMLCGIVAFGIAIRLLSLGFREGRYAPFSVTAIRWLVLSGIYNLACATILPNLLVSPFINAFFVLVGCKMGKNVRINTPFLNDAYLLKIGDNSVIGGKATLSCHIFEQGVLILKPITIGKNCVIGAHAYIHPGLEMEENSAIGVYAMVPKDTTIRANTVYGHLPAMPYRELARLTRFSKDRREYKKQNNARNMEKG